MTIISEDRYMEATDSYEGYCTNCHKFTRTETEPDAEKYPCPVCEKKTVMGAEQALLLGRISIGEDDEGEDV